MHHFRTCFGSYGRIWLFRFTLRLSLRFSFECIRVLWSIARDALSWRLDSAAVERFWWVETHTTVLAHSGRNDWKLPQEARQKKNKALYCHHNSCQRKRVTVVLNASNFDLTCCGDRLKKIKKRRHVECIVFFSVWWSLCGGTMSYRWVRVRTAFWWQAL